jgi:hypothetical protein
MHMELSVQPRADRNPGAATTTAATPAPALATPAARTEQLGRSRLLLTFLQFGLPPLGGKLFPYFFDVLVRRRQWMSAEDFIEGQTLARMLPGPAGTNLMIYLGLHLGGPSADVLGVVTWLLPGTLVALALSALVFGTARPAWSRAPCRASPRPRSRCSSSTWCRWSPARAACGSARR